jgi:uncharacterized protein YjiS (DUF1127 family)
MQHFQAHIAGACLLTHPVTITGRIRAVVMRRWSALGQWYRYRLTVRALEGLSDRTLRDIGIDRSEISSVAHAHRCRQGRDRILRNGTCRCRD